MELTSFVRSTTKTILGVWKLPSPSCLYIFVHYIICQPKFYAMRIIRLACWPVAFVCRVVCVCVCVCMLPTGHILRAIFTKFHIRVGTGPRKNRLVLEE